MKKEKLRQTRNQKGYTQKQIADILSTDVSNYSRKESGDVKIIKEEWQKIALFMNIPVDEIFEADQDLKPIYTKENTNSKIDERKFYISIISDLQKYIILLREEIERLKSS